MAPKSQRVLRRKNKRPKASVPPKVAKAPQADLRPTVDIILEDCDPKSFTGLEWLATSGRYVSGEQLAAAIAANPGVALPDGLRDYLCRFLRKKIKQKRGPKRSEPEVQFLIEFMAASEYQKELRRLQKERRFRGREAIGKGELSPHEEALKIIKERFRERFGSVTPRRIANIISSHN
jgi:hypothetical protein